MLLWEIDLPLTALTEVYGLERAARAWRASLRAASGLKALVASLGIQCELRDRNSVYLASGADGKHLLQEHELRRRVGLPGEYLDRRLLLDNFGFARAAAIVSPGAADCDPLQLSRGLLHVAAARGARLFDGAAVTFDAAGGSTTTGLENGREIESRFVVLATGYVMPDIVRASIHRVSSSWAIATRTQPHAIWNGGALVWEDAEHYNYARTTRSGRIIIGGEDSEEVIEPEERDRQIGQKSRLLSEKLYALWPVADPASEFRWAGAFDTSRDGLPLIGPVAGAKSVFAAYGYGGNGITFSFLAAQLLGDVMAGSRSPLLDDFRIEREGP